MKVTIKIIVFLTAIVLLNSCKKNMDTSPAPIPNGTMTMHLNGDSWTSAKNVATFLIDETDGNSAITFNGETSADLFVFGINFPTTSPNIAAKARDFGSAENDVVMVYSKKTAKEGTVTTHLTDQGTLIITSVDNNAHTISGTFTMKAHKNSSTASADSIKITNGIFTNISYDIQHMQHN